MKATLLLSEEDRKLLTGFYHYLIVWKHVLVVLIIGVCSMLLYLIIVNQVYVLVWFIFFFLLYGWFCFNANRKQLLSYEIDMQENVKIRVTGRMVDLVFEEAAQYITFCEDGFTDNEIFLLTYKNDKQIGRVRTGDRVELEYTPYCRYLLNIQPA
jgi:predicted membrane metal-binding protein